jgi:hypothetical protein
VLLQNRPDLDISHPRNCGGKHKSDIHKILAKKGTINSLLRAFIFVVDVQKLTHDKVHQKILRIAQFFW